MKHSSKKKIVPSYVFKKIDGIKHTPKCLGCGQKFVTFHSAKKYCDKCLNRGKKKYKKKKAKKRTIHKKAKKVKKLRHKVKKSGAKRKKKR